MTPTAALAALLPPEAIVPSAEADGVIDALVGHPPTTIVTPGSTDQVAAVMTWATREGVGVLPLASGSRVDPVRSGQPYIALSTRRLSGIEVYEPADLTITAGAGTPVREIDDALRAQRQWLPFDPPHLEGRSLGGLAVRGESGPLWMGYGSLRNHVLGMTAVTGDGRVLRLGGRVVKNVAGYDLLKPMVGSRGTLAVVTSLCVRAFPEPAVDHVLVHTADSVRDLTVIAGRVGTAPVMPVSSVLVDRLDAIDGSAALIVRFHGAERTVESDRRTLEGHVGAAFETLEEPGPILDVVRDHAEDAPVVVEATARPSRLGEVLGALDHLEPMALKADTYGGLVRAGLARVDRDAVESVRESIELFGGSLGVRRVPPDTTPGGLGSSPGADEIDLTGLLRLTFDPEGVLWPARPW